MSVKPLRTYEIKTGPIIVPAGDDYHVVEPAQVHTVSGREIKGYMMADQGYFQLYDLLGSVVFSAPTHTILWCRIKNPPLGQLAVVTAWEDENDHIDNEEDDDGQV